MKPQRGNGLKGHQHLTVGITLCRRYQRSFHMNSKVPYTLHRHPVTLCGTMIYTGVGIYTQPTPVYPIGN
ncbi:MAG: hypothetical protein IKP44_07580 [Bacteroidaceae bacterium]|nr:hypothetical protein [Bacteroidaceae bacterium]